jgi:hypothetical protein
MADRPVDSIPEKLSTIERSSVPLIRWLEELVDRPGFGTCIAFMAVIAGCLASFFTDDIKNAVPFVWPLPWHGQINPFALFFWIFVLTWFALFWVQQRVASKTIAFLQKQASEIAGKVVAVSKDIATIDKNTESIGKATQDIHLNVEATRESAADLHKSSQEALEKIERVNQAVTTVQKSATDLHKSSQEALGKIEHVDHAIKTVQDSAANLQKIVETLPLGAFVGEFGRLMAMAQDILGKGIARQSKIKDKGRLVVLLRDLLSIAATLAEAYDGRSNVRYAANVMIYVPAKPDKPYVAEPFLSLLKFWPKTEADLKSLSGVLVLTKDFTSPAHAHEKGHDTDDLVEELAFAIPKELRNNKTGQWRVLPGAPRVYVGEGVQSGSLRTRTHLIEDIGNFNFQELDIEKGCIKELQAYYGESGIGKAARSCLTFPLLNSGGQRYAVLNIHCNESPWLNGPGERQRNFTMLILPLVGEIGNVLELL